MTPEHPQSEPTVDRPAPWLAAMFVLIFIIGMPLSANAALAGSDFEAGIDGWLGYSCPNPGNCTAIAAGGNLGIDHVVGGGSAPGGGAPVGGSNFIQTVDPGATNAARVEPNPGVYGSLYAPGLILSFDALVRANGGGGNYDLDIFPGAPLVAIETPLGILVYLTADLPVIDGDWKHYEVPLINSSAWWLATLVSAGPTSDANFALALANMTRLTLISEWLKEGAEVDTGGIDNFAVVPLPAALPLLAAGLLGVRLGRIRGRCKRLRNNP